MNKHGYGEHPQIRDYGYEPFIFNLRHATGMNKNFRTTLWTGRNMQLTLMSIPARGEIGVEMHNGTDQFIRIEDGKAKIYVGNSVDNLREVANVDGGYAILVPAGTWHNIVNTGNRPLKLYSLYAPPQHPFGTVHPTKEDSDREEHK